MQDDPNLQVSLPAHNFPYKTTRSLLLNQDEDGNLIILGTQTRKRQKSDLVLLKSVNDMTFAKLRALPSKEKNDILKVLHYPPKVLSADEQLPLHHHSHRFAWWSYFNYFTNKPEEGVVHTNKESGIFRFARFHIDRLAYEEAVPFCGWVRIRRLVRRGFGALRLSQKFWNRTPAFGGASYLSAGITLNDGCKINPFGVPSTFLTPAMFARVKDGHKPTRMECISSRYMGAQYTLKDCDYYYKVAVRLRAQHYWRVIRKDFKVKSIAYYWYHQIHAPDANKNAPAFAINEYLADF
jgi:hypothetical protein